MAKSFLTPRIMRGAELLFCLTLGAILSIAAGQDASWDLRNYHLYNPLSVIQNRMDQDFFPADKHSGLNPLLDFLYIYLARGPLSHFPRLLAALMGFWYGLLVFVTLQIIKILFSSLPISERRLLIPLATLTAATGAMTLSQIGTSSNDIAVAMMVLSGLFVVLRTSNPYSWKTCVFSGLIFGLAGGAKLTAIVYAPALVLALLFTLPLRQSILASIAFSAAWLGGFLITFGWWGWMMWQRFANPVFPLMNGLFKSPLGPQLNLNDARFFPRDPLQWLAYPFFWAWDKSNHLVYEFDFRDPRMAIAYIAIIVFFWIKTRNFYRSRQGQPVTKILLTQPQKITLLFFTFSYLAWLTTTSILRYAITLEVLAILVALVVLMHMVQSTSVKKIVVLFTCLLCLLTARHSDWGHRAFSDKVIDVDMSWVQPDTLFLGVYEPVAYLAATVPPDLNAQFAGLGFISYLHGWPLGYTGEHLVRTHKGPIFVLFHEERRQFLQMLVPLGLSTDVKNCRVIESNLAPQNNPPLLACEVSHNGLQQDK